MKAGIVKWPMSVIRLNCADKDRLSDLAEKILLSWQNYSDENAFILSHTDYHAGKKLKDYN